MRELFFRVEIFLTVTFHRLKNLWFKQTGLRQSKKVRKVNGFEDHFFRPIDLLEYYGAFLIDL